jgi:hypothetical protein
MKKIIGILCLLAVTLFDAAAQFAYNDAILLRRYLKGNELSKANFTTPAQEKLKETIRQLESTEVESLNEQQMDAIRTKIIQLNTALENISNSKGDTILSILGYYFPGITINSTTIEVNNILKENPFFKTINYSGVPRSQFESKKLSLSSVSSSIGGLDVTNFADGLAQFMVERAKQELNIAFFQRFKEYLDDPRFSDLQKLFPETYLALDRIDTKIYQLNNYIQTLREAMATDLAQIYEHSADVLNQEKYDAFFALNPALDLAWRGGLQIAQGLQHKQHPGIIIQSLASEPFRNMDKPAVHNTVASVKVFDLLSQSLRSSDSGMYWVNADSVYRKLLADETTLKIYLGLVYQNSKKENLGFLIDSKTVPFTKVLDTLAVFINRDLDPFKKYIRTIVTKAGRVQQLITEIKPDQAGKVDPEAVYRFFSTTLDLIDAGVEVKWMPDSPVKRKIEAAPVQKYTTAARLTCNLALNVKSGEYSSAVINLASLYDLLFTQADKDSVNAVAGRIRALLEEIPAGDRRDKLILSVNDYLTEPSASGLKQLEVLTKSENTGNKPAIVTQVEYLSTLIFSVNMQKTITLLVHYGTFISNMVNATSPEEVKSALEAAAMPVGSYRMKRQSVCNISVNAYLGATVGRQFEKPENTWVFGAWGPVGPEISWGKFRKDEKKASSSFSIFVPLIDVGAIALFRVNDTATELKTSVSLNQIFSPGLIVSWGIPGWPVSLSAGYQITPLLQSVETGQPVISDKNSGRLIISAAVDIPLFNIYNSPDRKKDALHLIKVKDNGKLRLSGY